MSDFSASRVARVTTEFTVVFVSVLVALVLESWWSEREERQFESDVRADMVGEFQQNLGILDTDMATNDRMRGLAAQLIDLEPDELFALPSSAFAVWEDPDSYQWSLFDPYQGSAQALVQSGNLGVVSDRALRQQLSGWAGLLEEKDRYGEMASNSLFRDQFPAIADITADGVWSPDERREFQTLVEQMVFVMGLVTNNHERLRAAAEDVLEYLESN